MRRRVLYNIGAHYKINYIIIIIIIIINIIIIIIIIILIRMANRGG